MVTLEKIAAVRKETTRFLAILQKAENRIKELGKSSGYYGGLKETAASKRASLDLTRALADFRRP